MPTLTVTKARSNLYRLIDSVTTSHEPVLITGKRGNAMLVSEEDWQAIEETMYLLGVPGMRESIVEGLNAPLDDCVDEDEIEW